MRRGCAGRHRKSPGATLIVGFDSEYQRSGPGRNDVLCLSFAALDPDTGDDGIRRAPRQRRHRPTASPDAGGVAGPGRVSRPEGRRSSASAPDRIVLAAHWSRADLPAFRDFPRLKLRFDSPRKTYATTTKPAVMTLPLPSGPRRVSVTLVDTMLLAPAGQQSLDALGRNAGHAQARAARRAPSTRMRAFSAEDPELFQAYAERDAEIAARYTLEVWRFLDQIGALGQGGQSAADSRAPRRSTCCGRVARDRGIDLDAVARIPARSAPAGDRARGRRRTSSPTPSASTAGGTRRSAVGYTPRATIHDVDLCGAYTTALAHIREPDWGSRRGDARRRLP